MTLCRSRGEPGRARHGGEQFNTVFGAWLGAHLFLMRTLQQLSLPAAPRHRPIASLWRARLSIALAREKYGLAPAHLPCPRRFESSPSDSINAVVASPSNRYE